MCVSLISISVTKYLKSIKGKFYCGLWFQSRVVWLHYIGPEVGQNIMVASHVTEEAAHFLAARNEREREIDGV